MMERESASVQASAAHVEAWLPLGAGTRTRARHSIRLPLRAGPCTAGGPSARGRVRAHAAAPRSMRGARSRLKRRSRRTSYRRSPRRVGSALSYTARPRSLAAQAGAPPPSGSRKLSSLRARRSASASHARASTSRGACRGRHTWAGQRCGHGEAEHGLPTGRSTGSRPARRSASAQGIEPDGRADRRASEARPPIRTLRHSSTATRRRDACPCSAALLCQVADAHQRAGGAGRAWRHASVLFSSALTSRALLAQPLATASSSSRSMCSASAPPSGRPALRGPGRSAAGGRARRAPTARPAAPRRPAARAAACRCAARAAARAAAHSPPATRLRASEPDSCAGARQGGRRAAADRSAGPRAAYMRAASSSSRSATAFYGRL